MKKNKSYYTFNSGWNFDMVKLVNYEWQPNNVKTKHTVTLAEFIADFVDLLVLHVI